jgi:hydrogenase nickel incorporation protein HypB
MGAPGVGKTTSLIQIIKQLKNVTPYVIEGDIEADFDTKTLQSLGVKAIQINTGGACHLDSPLIGDAVSKLNLNNGVLFIENIGNLVCPAEFMIGEHAKMLISNVTEGSDKPYKYPLAFEKANIILLNKCDLLPYVDFDEDFFMKGVRALNKTAPVIKVSGKTGEGFDQVVSWIMEKVNL